MLMLAVMLCGYFMSLFIGVPLNRFILLILTLIRLLIWVSILTACTAWVQITTVVPSLSEAAGFKAYLHWLNVNANSGVVKTCEDCNWKTIQLYSVNGDAICCVCCSKVVKA